MDTKQRRKNLGWSRAELAERAGIDRRLVQLIELGQWEEQEALARVEAVLEAAEGGRKDVRLEPVKMPDQ